MWPTNQLTKLLKIKIPIIQAPMAGSATTAELTAAAANAGALGSIGAGYMTAAELRQIIKKTRSLTYQPFAVNLFIPGSAQATAAQIQKAKQAVDTACAELNIQLDDIKPPYVPSFEEQINVVLEENIPIFSFTFGVLSESWIKKFKQQGVVLIGTATNLKEARQLVDQDIDIIVAQSSEAGGHRGTFIGAEEESLIGMTALIPQLVDQIQVPIIAAGGIMDARGVISALSLGAAGVQMGTAFLTCPECGMHPKYKARLLNLKSDETVLTRAFSGRLARGIKNKFIEQMHPFEDTVLDYPIQHALTREMRKAAERQNNIDFINMWAGQSASLSQGVTATQLIENLHQDVLALLHNDELILLINILKFYVRCGGLRPTP